MVFIALANFPNQLTVDTEGVIDCDGKEREEAKKENVHEWSQNVEHGSKHFPLAVDVTLNHRMLQNFLVIVILVPHLLKGRNNVRAGSGIHLTVRTHYPPALTATMHAWQY